MFKPTPYPCPCQGNQVQMQVDAHLMGEAIFHKSVQLQKDSLPGLHLLANQKKFPSSRVNDSTGWQGESRHVVVPPNMISPLWKVFFNIYSGSLLGGKKIYIVCHQGWCCPPFPPQEKFCIFVLLKKLSYLLWDFYLDQISDLMCVWTF